MSDFVRWFTGGNPWFALVDLLLVCMIAWQVVLLLFWLAVGSFAQWHREKCPCARGT